MSRVRLAGAVALAALAGPAAAQDGPRKHAVLVGVDRYDHPKLGELRYAAADVADLAGVLGPAGYAVTLVTDKGGQKPTKAAVDAQIAAVLDRCKAGDTVVLAFAGHGVQFEGQRDAYFCPQDARPFPDRQDTLVSLTRVYAALERSLARVKVLLVDACRDDPTGGRGARGVDAGAAPPPPRGVAALFSCSPGERAFEHDALKHGVFFFHVLSGLKGKARDSDGEVTFGGLADYVQKQVSRDVPRLVGGGAKQSPNLRVDLSGASPVLIPAAGGARQVAGPAESAEDLFVRGRARLRQGDGKGALADLDKALALAPGDHDGLVSRAEAHLWVGNIPAAAADAEAAVRAAPGKATGYETRAVMAFIRNRPADAVADFTKAVALDPGNPRHLGNRARALFRADRDAEGLADLEAALRLDPGRADDHDLLGQVVASAGDLPRADKAFRAAVRLAAPADRPKYQNHLGQLLRQQGKVDEAAGVYGDVLADPGRRKPDDVYTALLGRAACSRAQNNYPAALRDLTQAVKVKPKEAKAYRDRAAVHTALGDAAAADADRREAARLSPPKAGKGPN